MGILDNYKTEDFAEMKRVEQAIVAALQPFTAMTDPLLVVIALARCLRVMLRLGDARAQRQLLPVVEDYLRGRTQARGENILWTPDSRN